MQRAAQMMDELNVGALPVCEGEQLVGMITDRDITVRSTAAGRAPNEARVEEVMSEDVRWFFEDQSLDDVMQQMADTQIRRVPVLSHDEQHKLIGIVALGDLVTKRSEGSQKDELQQVMEKISYPSQPDMPKRCGNVYTDGGDVNAAPGGIDAAGASGASSGTAGTEGSAGSDGGARP